MFSSKASFLSLLLALTTTITTTPTTVLAAPTRDAKEVRIEDVQCRCLSFSTSAKPSPCTYLESHNLDWHTAYTYASDNDLKLEFASEETITTVLAIPKPLPSSILLSIKRNKEQQSQQQQNPQTTIKNTNKIICGLDHEVNHLSSDITFSEPELHYVSAVIASFTLFLIIWIAAEYLWTRYLSRSRNSTGTIKLTGKEQCLKATPTHAHTECAVSSLSYARI
ncbi:hypothetical protein J1614_007590 [Plenodomus biglobosus]|nr:hypothetical protein J1614_007590 [Plenodomus biglobosus]